MPSNLRSARKMLGLERHGGLAKLAALLGVPYSTVTKWERGERKMPAVARQAVRMLLILHEHGLTDRLK